MRTFDKVMREKVKIFGIELEFIDFLFMMVMMMLGLILRFSIFDMVSGDYSASFADWMKEIRNAHAAGLPYIGIEPGGDDNLSTFDYNCLYQYLLVFINLFNNGGGNDIYLVKLVPCVFDLVMAFTAFRIVYEMSKSIRKSEIIFAAVLCFPTIVLNSAGWAQNDSIYTSFVLLSFLSLIRKKDVRCWIYFSIAFCFKQQAIFFLPVLIIAFLKNKLKFRYILLTPLFYVINVIPAAIAGMFVNGQVTVLVTKLVDTGNVTWTSDHAVVNGSVVLEPVGRTFLSLLGIYSNQVSMFSRLTMNYPNIYTIIQTGLDKSYRSMIITAGELTCVMVFGILAYYLYKKNTDMNNKLLLIFAVFSCSLIVYCLPCMHERYGYVAEVFALIYAMFGIKRLFIALVMEGITLVTYTRYLWGASSSLTTANLVVFAYILLAVILFTSIDFYNELNKANTNGSLPANK